MTFKKILALMLACLMLFAAACDKTPNVPKDTDGNDTTNSDTTNSDTSKESDSEEDTLPPEVGDRTVYNVIFALATVPPVLAALDSIENGNETYAMIERGKTYNGIESLEKFHNIGFDTTSNLSNGFTAKEFDDTVNAVKAIREADSDAYFLFYVQDGTAMRGAAVAANAGLTTEDFHIYMCEDGTGAYTSLNSTYIVGKNVTADKDEVYDNYAAKVAQAKAEFEAVMAKKDNQNGDAVLGYNIGKAFALAALDNFTYYLQDEDSVVDVLKSAEGGKTRLLSAFGVEGYNEDTELKLNLKYQKISDGISKLDEAQRTAYLTLMYGQYYEDTYAALIRETRAGEKAPADKLVFIGSRHNYYPHFASDAKYGIGGLDAGAMVPESYAELDEKYKSPLLFATEEDYKIFLDALNDADNYGDGATDEAKKLAKRACFNLYIDYIFTLKLTYALYGEQYDIIMKGHPREAIGCYGEWGNMYRVKLADESVYVYDKLLDSALQAFHSKDSTGKYIGTVPYGTSAENLAYLGVDIAIAGLPSSTYNGYDTDVDVLFILGETDQDIAGSGSAEVYSQVKARYEAGNLLYTDANGVKQTAVFYNTGNVLKTASEILTAKGNEALAGAYKELFSKWLSAVYPNAIDIDAQGFAVGASK